MNPILFDFGIIQIHWYSFLLLIAFIIGGKLALKEAKREKISETFMVDLFFYLIPVAFIGARLYYVIFNWSYYGNNLVDILKVWEGGLAIHGGILASFIFLFFYCKRKNVNLWKITDIFVVSLILGQAIGRWGNFFNGEAHGALTTLQALQNLHLPNFIIDGMYIDGNYYQPTFLYESLWDFIGFILLYLVRKRKQCKIGEPTSFYLIWYGIGRFIIEGMRTDSLMLYDLKIAQLVSIVMVILGILMLIFSTHQYYHEERNQ